jgi:hypothetical protein
LKRKHGCKIFGNSSPVQIETVDAYKVLRDAYCDLGLTIGSAKARHIPFNQLSYDTTVSLRVLSGTKYDGSTGGQVLVVSGSAQMANQQTFAEETQFHLNKTPQELIRYCTNDRTHKAAWLNNLSGLMASIDSGAAPTDRLYREVDFEVSRDTQIKGGINYVAILEGSYSTSITTRHWVRVETPLPQEAIAVAQNEWWGFQNAQPSVRQTRRAEKTAVAQNEWWGFQNAQPSVRQTRRAEKTAVAQNEW